MPRRNNRIKQIPGRRRPRTHAKDISESWTQELLQKIKKEKRKGTYNSIKTPKL